MSSLGRAVALAGFFAAHAIWCVSTGETLIPMVGLERGEERTLVRFATEELSEGATKAREHLEANPDGFDRAVMVVDGYVTLGGNKSDALIIEVVEYEPRRSIKIIVPYRSASTPDGFAVHRPKFLAAEGDSSELAQLGDAYFGGVDAHEEGAKVWNDHLEDLA